LALGAGALVAFQPPVNALLARHVGDLSAAFVSLGLSTLMVGALMVIAGQAGQLTALEPRPEYLIGGIAGVAVVVGSIVGVRWLGAGALAAALVATQLGFSLVIDRFGWLGVTEQAITLQRIAGVVLLMAGTVLVTSR
jgi:transporter family-2 protein